MGKEINWINHTNRSYLKDILPLDTPLKVEIEPTSACNFRCIYCRQSAVNIKSEFMSMDIFDKVIEGCLNFPNRIKSFNFAGVGEPLLNKNIYKMIENANKIADDTILITNGSLINKENADKLIKSKIKNIRISLQGINEEDYFNISKFKINFKDFLDNIKYLYENKTNETKLHLKMPDIAINTEERKNVFYELFEDKCDYLIIQNICNFFNDVDYSKMNLSENNILGNKIKEIKVCHFPFYSIYVDKSGIVFPCCHMYGNIDIGNINEESLDYIWNGNRLKNLRINLLTKHIQNTHICSTCTNAKSYSNQYDYLDDDTDRILNIYKK